MPLNFTPCFPLSLVLYIIPPFGSSLLSFELSSPPIYPLYVLLSILRKPTIPSPSPSPCPRPSLPLNRTLTHHVTTSSPLRHSHPSLRPAGSHLLLHDALATAARSDRLATRGSEARNEACKDWFDRRIRWGDGACGLTTRRKRCDHHETWSWEANRRG